MTHDEATARAAQLNADDAREHQWFPRQTAPDDWDVVSVAAPGLRRRGPLKEAVETKPRPSEAPDPRSTLVRNIPPFGPGA